MNPSLASPLAWDYTALAAHYDKRADYDAGLVADTLHRLGLAPGDAAAEIGAGTGKLTRLLCRHGLRVLATEPNDAMRALGMRNQPEGAEWIAARGESLPLPDASVALAAYGSSFNVLDTQPALDECARILRPGGHWLALWNHRDLDDPLQHEVESIIRRHIPDYSYGSRRQDPSDSVLAHGAFTDLAFAERGFTVSLDSAEWLAAWHSHATLARQAGEHLPAIMKSLESLIRNADTVTVPYTTRVWTARRNRP